jgi:hypothetical protein
MHERKVRGSGMHHLIGADIAVELLATEETEAQRRLFEREILRVSQLGDLGGLVVANDRVKRRDQHQRVRYMARDRLAVGFDTNHA